MTPDVALVAAISNVEISCTAFGSKPDAVLFFNTFQRASRFRARLKEGRILLQTWTWGDELPQL